MQISIYRDHEFLIDAEVTGPQAIPEAIFTAQQHYGPGEYVAVEREEDERTRPQKLADTVPERRLFRLTTEWVDEE